MASKTTSHATRQSPNFVKQYDSQQFGNSDIIVATPAVLQSFLCSNKSAGVLYLLFFDAQAVPANSAVPLFCPVIMAAGATLRFPLNDVSGYGYDGLATLAGLCWAASTTAGTLTVDASSSVWVTARYLN